MNKKIEQVPCPDGIPHCGVFHGKRVEMTKEEKLFQVCKKFIEEQKISCVETIGQSDRVIENAYDFIEEVCDVVGYYKYPDDDSDDA